jgi:hypothetical protein
MHVLYRMYHLKRYPTVTYYGTKIKSDVGPPHVIHTPNLPPDTRVKVTLVARPLLTPTAQVRTRCIHQQNVCSSSKITSHRNRSLLFVKHLATRILTRNYWTRQQYTDWQLNFRTQEVFATGNMSGVGQCWQVSRSAEETLKTNSFVLL